MVEVATSLSVGIVATFVPLIVGLFLPKALASLRKTPHSTVWMAAFSAGIIFWFFIDVMGDAAQLDINQGFGGGYTHLALALSFAVGVGVLFGLERRFSRPRNLSSTDPNLQIRSVAADITFAIAAVAALGIGFHALGEGMGIGVSLPKAVNIYDAIGGVYPGVAYVLHKFFEGFVIGSFAVVASCTRLRHIGILAALSGIPTVIGFFIGLPATLDSTYMFALGGAGAVYVEMKLIPVLARSGRFYAAILPFLIGLYAMYVAGLFHSVANG
jgi:zinc transporter ZupT